MWRSGLQEALSTSREQVQVVMHSERVHVDAHRSIFRIDIVQSVVAKTDDARFLLRIVPPSPHLDLAQLRLIPGPGCGTTGPAPVVCNDVAAFPIGFDQRLRAGQTHHIEYAVDYRSALGEPGTPTWEAAVETGCLLDAAGPPLELRVQFDERVLPVHVRQIYLTHPDSPENRVRELDLDLHHGAHMFVASPTAGCHGIRWEWPRR